jgi:hypothetical protein
MLSVNSTGVPDIRTRTAAVDHPALTHGPFPSGGTKGQPETT